MLFNIQKCSIHDGDGLRTLVFFKGCPLHCLWCANPESQSYRKELMEAHNKCIACKACVNVCPVGAIHPTAEGFAVDRKHCIECFACADKCFAGAKYTVGKEYSIPELLKEIEKDKIFYKMKGGGVTFSGGEPLTQPDYLTEIARACRKRGIHVMLESCAVGDYNRFKTALPFIDAMYIDIKHIDSNKHKELTGLQNELILENIRKISYFDIPITIRTPIIPSLNDDKENICGIAEFIKTLPSVKDYELLIYHRFGVNKYKALGRPYALDGLEPPTDEKMQALVKSANDVLKGSGITCFYTKDNARIVCE